jgi:hypothetical protein
MREFNSVNEICVRISALFGTCQQVFDFITIVSRELLFELVLRELRALGLSEESEMHAVK